jgi:AraC family transcriptional regulator, transcriptional activator of the genes for pyochelin and ferripyochelin receptors
MPIKLSEEEEGPLELFQTLPASMREWDIRSSLPLACQGEKCQLLFQEFRGKGFSAWYNRFWAQQHSILRARADLAVMELRIGWMGQLHGDWERVPQLALKPREFSLSFTPHIDNKATLAAGKSYATFDIHVERRLLEEMGIQNKDLDEFWGKVENGQPAELTPYPQVCPAPMLDSVQLILGNPYSTKAQPQLLEWNSKQLLLIALETAASPERPLPITLLARDIEGLHAIKQFIADRFPEWPPHSLLCRKGGINDFKLKAGFKHLFKMTAYDYHMQLKFQEAKKLLLENKESIKAIAYQIGYDHHPSFTQEFKKQFGYTPSWFQKHGRL